MTDGLFWVLIGVAVLIVLLAIIAIVATRKNKRPTDYYSLFVIGLIWLIIGVVAMFIPDYEFNFFFILGLVFFIIGLANKNKWKKNRLTWKKLNKKERKFRMILIIILGVLVFVGVVFFLLAEKGLI